MKSKLELSYAREGSCPPPSQLLRGTSVIEASNIHQ